MLPSLREIARQPLVAVHSPLIGPRDGYSRALGSVVEHRLHTAGVSGSNPLAPTSFHPAICNGFATWGGFTGAAQVPLRDRRLKCGIHVIVSVRRIILHLPADSDARPPRVGSLPSRLVPVRANSEIPRHPVALCGHPMAAGSPSCARPWDILRLRLTVADAGAGAGGGGHSIPSRSQGGGDHLTPLDGHREEGII